THFAIEPKKASSLKLPQRLCYFRMARQVRGFLIPFFAILAPGSAVRRPSSRASHARGPLLRHLRAVVESLAFCSTCCWSAIDFASANDEERGRKQPDFPTGSRDRDSICAGCSFLCTRSAPA